MIRCILDSKARHLRYTNHITLDTVSARVIHGSADDQGAGVSALMEQFIDRLRQGVVEYDHTADFHDGDDGGG